MGISEPPSTKQGLLLPPGSSSSNRPLAMSPSPAPTVVTAPALPTSPLNTVEIPFSARLRDTLAH